MAYTASGTAGTERTAERVVAEGQAHWTNRDTWSVALVVNSGPGIRAYWLGLAGQHGAAGVAGLLAQEYGADYPGADWGQLAASLVPVEPTTGEPDTGPLEGLEWVQGEAGELAPLPMVADDCWPEGWAVIEGGAETGGVVEVW